MNNPRLTGFIICIDTTPARNLHNVFLDEDGEFKVPANWLIVGNHMTPETQARVRLIEPVLEAEPLFSVELEPQPATNYEEEEKERFWRGDSAL